MTAPPELHQRLLRPLVATGVPFMVTGGVAAIVYGEPRLTNDVDIVLGLAHADAERLVAAFSPDRYYVPPVDVIRVEVSRAEHGHFNVLDLGLRAEWRRASQIE